MVHRLSAPALRRPTLHGHPYRMGLVAATLLAILWLHVVPAIAAIAVVETGSLLAQAILETSRTLQLVTLMTRDLAPLTQIGLALNLLQELQVILGDLDRLSQQMAGRRSIWGSVSVIPSTNEALAAFRGQAEALCHTTTQDGLGALSLLDNATRLLSRLTVLLEGVQQLFGTVAGLQQISVSLGHVSGNLALMQGMMASSNEPKLCEQWQISIRRQGMAAMQRRAFETWGTVRE